MPRTTMNIHLAEWIKISWVAARLAKTKREVIIMLLARLMPELEQLQGEFTTVKYQEDDPEGWWHRYTILIRSDELEFWSNIRRLCKLSLSNLIAMAVEKHWGRLLEEQTQEIHKYVRFIQYKVLRGGNFGLMVCGYILQQRENAPNQPKNSKNIRKYISTMSKL
ncbi:MAG: hypothetical protein EPN93_20595 [Spirochaetes bacterium]|nr:MAG: hypothetical protein EPN93_20595 [Spirochaetota bacterium]